ncbi:unnamed protein product [Protopolystoma xenopodis]|uniref:Uncharacterized protein n=1 Tax=Protopolystoma xenopodis TaxID=117903 RepID=A0A448X627_9PLAT|nr:unnamed protein product [Protopolystoma xenopodis]
MTNESLARFLRNRRRLPRKQRQHESSSKANRQLARVHRNQRRLPRKQRQHESSSKANRQLGIEGDYLGNSVSMNLPVKPIDSWSSGIRHWSSSGGTDIRISSRNTFTRTPSLVVFWWNRPSNLFTQHFHSKWKAVVFWWH